MEFIIGILIMIVTSLVFYFILTIVLLCVFIGIPCSIKFRKKGILSRTRIAGYLISIILWSSIMLLIVFLANKYFENYLVYFITSLIYALLVSFKSLGTQAASKNMNDFIQYNQNNIDFEKLNEYFEKL